MKVFIMSPETIHCHFQELKRCNREKEDELSNSKPRNERDLNFKKKKDRKREREKGKKKRGSPFNDFNATCKQ